MTPNPTDVRHVIGHLRRMVPRAGRRDREALLTAVEAILELSERLHRAEHPELYARQHLKVDVLEQAMQGVSQDVLREQWRDRRFDDPPTSPNVAIAPPLEDEHADDLARMADEGCPHP